MLGILLGHLLTIDSMGPALGGADVAVRPARRGMGPDGRQRLAARSVVKCLPSYWLVQAGKTGYGGDAWPLQAWIVLVVWTAGLSALAVWAYRRDTGRRLSVVHGPAGDRS